MANLGILVKNDVNSCHGTLRFNAARVGGFFNVVTKNVRITIKYGFAGDVLGAGCESGV